MPLELALPRIDTLGRTKTGEIAENSLCAQSWRTFLCVLGER